MKLAFNSRVGLFFLSLVFAVINDIAESNDVADDQSSSNKVQECGVYFAESTIPGAGWGMFAGKNYTKGSEVTPGDIAVPILDLDWHNNFQTHVFLWEEYVWGASQIPFMSEEVSGEGISAASMGVGAAINCRLNLVNVVDNWMQADNAGLHRSKDFGIGGFTPYFDRRAVASKHIEQGAELYMSYGENYFESRASDYGMIPLSENYKRADEMLQRYNKLLKRLRETGHSKELEEALWELIVTKSFGDKSRTLNALPKRTSEIEKALEIGTANLNYNDSVRSLEWLEENGKCMDNIRPGISTIPQAGRGAFASRFIPKGGLVAPAPLIQLPDKKRLLMYDSLEGADGKLRRNASSVVHAQLLLNYCWGHSASSLLLCPYGVLTGLPNHSSRPNTKLQWAANHTMRHPEWRDKPILHMKRKSHAGLVFDFVALEDIQEGDEVLIDYGKEWEEAWNKHVRNWVPPKKSENYRPGFELNNDLDLKLWPYFERPYYDSSSLHVWVHDAYRDMSGLTKLPARKRSDFHLARITKRYAMNEKDMYLVELVERRGDKEKDNMTFCTETLFEVLFGVPKDAIYFEDDPYTRDIHLHSTFRHEMMIPDDLFPEAWKNRKQRK